MQIQTEQLSRAEIYSMMVQTIIPRPVAWVLSEDEGSNYNLAPFSYFNAVSSEPPLVMLSMGKKPEGVEKDTRRNIREQSHFVIHIPTRELAQQVTDSSVVLPHGESEVERLGLSLTDFPGSPLPRLADCPIAMACERYQVVEIGPVPQALILGEVKQVYIDDAVLADHTEGKLRVDAHKVDPIARLGGNDYSTLGEIFTIARPQS